MKMFLLLIILLLPCSAWAAALTSNAVGTTGTPALASAGSTWVGGVAPVDGDTITIVSGAVIVQDVNRTYGSNASSVGHAITINGASSSSFGTYQVADGVSLTLRGTDLTTNTLMLVNRYGTFAPQPGTTIIGDVAGDYTSFILNKGNISAIGTSLKPITFTSPSGAYSNSNAVASEAFSGTSWKYDPVNNIGCVAFTHAWINTVSFSAKTPSTILTTEVFTLAEVNSAGKYYINYDMGMVWFYHVSSSGNPAFTKTYNYTAVSKGWGISSTQSTTFNTALFDHCNFSYMGKNITPADVGRTLDVQNKKSATAGADQLFYLKNSTFTYCSESLGLKKVNGTAADLIQITGNTFNNDGGNGTYGYAISSYRDSFTYVNISDNVLNLYGHFILTSIYSPTTDYTGIQVKGNTGVIANNLLYAQPGLATFSASEISGNVLYGVGGSGDQRVIEAGGLSGSPLVIKNNEFHFINRTFHYASYSRFTDNIVHNSFHHGVVANTFNDIYTTDIEVKRNVFITEAGLDGAGYGSPNIELGYNHRHWIDLFTIENNTFIGNPQGWLGFGDMQDTDTYSLVTRLTIRNNLAKRIGTSPSTGARKRTVAAASIWRGQVLQFDFNLDHNYQARYSGSGTPGAGDALINRQGTFTGLSNVAGVALWNPTFSTKSSGTLTYTYTSATDRTLAWGAGTPVQLLLNSYTGTATAGGTLSTQGVVTGGTLTDSGKTFPTTKNDANCPMQHWLLITGGTGSGQIRAITNNTATVLSVTPAWTTTPDTTSTYAIIKSDVSLVDGAETVQAGIYLPSLPTSTQTDTGIAFADHSLTAQDPLLSNASGLTFADMTPSSSSPVKAAGYGGVDIGAVAVSVAAGFTKLWGLGFGM